MQLAKNNLTKCYEPYVIAKLPSKYNNCIKQLNIFEITYSNKTLGGRSYRCPVLSKNILDILKDIKAKKAILFYAIYIQILNYFDQGKPKSSAVLVKCESNWSLPTKCTVKLFIVLCIIYVVKHNSIYVKGHLFSFYNGQKCVVL